MLPAVHAGVLQILNLNLASWHESDDLGPGQGHYNTVQHECDGAAAILDTPDAAGYIDSGDIIDIGCCNLHCWLCWPGAPLEYDG